MAYKRFKQMAPVLTGALLMTGLLISGAARADYILGDVTGCVFDPLGCPAPDGGLFASSMATLVAGPEALVEFFGAPELAPTAAADFDNTAADGFTLLTISLMPADFIGVAPALDWTFGGLDTGPGSDHVLSGVELVSIDGLPLLVSPPIQDGLESILVQTGPITAAGSVTLRLLTEPGEEEEEPLPSPAPLGLALLGAYWAARRR